MQGQYCEKIILFLTLQPLLMYIIYILIIEFLRYLLSGSYCCIDKGILLHRKKIK